MQTKISIIVVLITVLASVITTSAAVAIELKRTPLQDQLASNINSFYNEQIFASLDEFDNEINSQRVSDNTEKKSIVKAAFYSALLPGLGEYYVGNRRKARVFFAVEATAWIGFLSYKIYGNWKEDDLISFASEYADANLEGKSQEFQDWVGFYDDIDQYNSLGRVQDQDRPYLVDNSENHWRWQSDDDRANYRRLKNSSREAFRRANFLVGLAVVNRIVSIIDAVRDAKRTNSEIKEADFSLVGKIKYRLEINPFSNNKPVSFALVARF
ncbi:MAG: hypothetical protein IID63_04820 [candidate division Zixibacteria bacterium]|nr:hypothetical protein [candidate division Zixibacteria bacterium]